MLGFIEQEVRRVYLRLSTLYLVLSPLGWVERGVWGRALTSEPHFLGPGDAAGGSSVPLRREEADGPAWGGECGQREGAPSRRGHPGLGMRGGH